MLWVALAVQNCIDHNKTSRVILSSGMKVVEFRDPATMVFSGKLCLSYYSKVSQVNIYTPKCV